MQAPQGTGASYIRIGNERFDDDRQRAAIDQWLATQGLTIKPEHHFEDLGFNRDTPLETRTGLQALLKAVRGGTVQWVVVDSKDRLRATDPAGLDQVLQTLREHGCELITFEPGEQPRE